MKRRTADENGKLQEDLVQLVRLGLAARADDVRLYARRMNRRLSTESPDLAERIASVLDTSPTRSSPLRKDASFAPAEAVPVDLDSRMHLAHVEQSPQLDHEPVFVESVGRRLGQLVKERREVSRLEAVGLAPTRTALFVGQPGVGKTLSARWVARELGVPLVTLNLGSVMSSFLGRTGNNLRHVLDYAKSIECVLLLDELDAVAKRRDDSSEVGELKRLVTVLLQEIDRWPVGGLLLAATNHPDLLDPAVWRRFELVVEFPPPEGPELEAAIRIFFGGDGAQANASTAKVLSHVFAGSTFSDIERAIKGARRSVALSGEGEQQLVRTLVRQRIELLKRSERAPLAAILVKSGLVTQREAHEMTGVSRDTIRKNMSEGEGAQGHG